jgi:hypothetical protein
MSSLLLRAHRTVRRFDTRYRSGKGAIGSEVGLDNFTLECIYQNTHLQHSAGLGFNCSKIQVCAVSIDKDRIISGADVNRGCANQKSPYYASNIPTRTGNDTVGITLNYRAYERHCRKQFRRKILNWENNAVSIRTSMLDSS